MPNKSKRRPDPSPVPRPRTTLTDVLLALETSKGFQKPGGVTFARRSSGLPTCWMMTRLAFHSICQRSAPSLRPSARPLQV